MQGIEETHPAYYLRRRWWKDYFYCNKSKALWVAILDMYRRGRLRVEGGTLKVSGSDTVFDELVASMVGSGVNSFANYAVMANALVNAGVFTWRDISSMRKKFSDTGIVYLADYLEYMVRGKEIDYGMVLVFLFRSNGVLYNRSCSYSEGIIDWCKKLELSERNIEVM